MALRVRWSSGNQIWYDGTQIIFTVRDDDEGLLVGYDGNGVDFKFYGDSTGAYMLWDEGGDKLYFFGGAGISLDNGDIALGDADFITFGDTPDITINWTAATSGLDVLPATAYADLRLGSTSKPLDVTFTGTTGSAKWVSSGAEFLFDEADIGLGDTDYIIFGDDNDFTVTCTTGDVLEFLPATSGDNMHLGSATKPLDVVNYGNITYRDPNTNTLTTGSTGLITLTAESNRVQFVSHSSGQPIVITLPSATGCAGIEFKIVNKSTGSSGSVTIEGSTGAAVAFIPTSTGTTGGGAALIFCDGTSWGAMIGFASTY